VGSEPMELIASPAPAARTAIAIAERNFILMAILHRCLAKRPGAAEQETGGSEPSGYCEHAALARFKRDLLGQHDVSDRQIAVRQET
jgi:hypothetical protein